MGGNNHVGNPDAVEHHYEATIGEGFKKVIGYGADSGGIPRPIYVETDGSINVNFDVGDSLTVKQSTHDNLNANANIQVGDADVANGNPVPVSDAGGSLTVDGPLTDTELRASPVDSEITDGTNVVDIVQASDWFSAIDTTTSDSLKVAALNHQLWPTSGNRTGVAGDGNFYGQLMNDLGDLVVSLGSITSSSGSVQIDRNTGNASAGTQRVVLASDQPVLSVDDNGSTISVDDGGSTISVDDGGGTLTVDGTVAATQSGDWDTNQKTILSKAGTLSSGNNTLVAAAGSGIKIKVLAFSITMADETLRTYTFEDGAGGTDIWLLDLQAPADVTVGANLAVPPPGHLFETSANTLLNLNVSGGTTAKYSLTYIEEA